MFRIFGYSTICYSHIQYSNIEIGVIAGLDKRDQYLVKLAEARRSIAKAERKLAHCRAKETMILHHIQCIKKEVADRRLAQADVNIERAKFYYKRATETQRHVGAPFDIITALSKPAFNAIEPLAIN